MPTDHTKRSDKQIAHYLNQKMDKIWRIGDRGIECAGKHICWGAAALAVGKDWTDGLDYPRPWSCSSATDTRGYAIVDDSLLKRMRVDPKIYGDRLQTFEEESGEIWHTIDWHDKEYNAKEARLADAWESVVTVRDQLGEKRFHDCMMRTRYYGHFEDYVESMLREVSK